jgi:UDP-perosamine 4-acetyltransferase
LSISSKKVVILLGAGGHAKVVAEALIQSGKTILGLVAPDKKKGSKCFGLDVLGNDDELFSYSPREVVLANGIGALPGKVFRWKLASQMREKGFQFTRVIHPSATIAADVIVAEGAQVMAGSIIQPGSSIGQDSIVNTRVSIDHDCKIGENCHLAPGVILSGCVNIGKGAHLGTGSTVIQNISIGENSTVSAGSIVYKDLANDRILIQKKQNIYK